VIRVYDGAGRIETTRVVVPAEIATGHRAVELYTECFLLVAFASTASELADKVSSLPAPPCRELLAL
jgi:hypothetical protein